MLRVFRDKGLFLSERDTPDVRSVNSDVELVLRYVSENITLPIERDNTTWNLSSWFLIYTVVAATRNSPETISTKFLFIIFSEIGLRWKELNQNLSRLAKAQHCPELFQKVVLFVTIEWNPKLVALT
jgi:uncharacterized membrane protein